MTLSRPRTTGRVLRGSALGLGLLVAGGITAPAAFAIEGTAGGSSTDTPGAASSSPAPLVQVTPEVAATMAPALSGDFGTGKDFTVQVRPYGPVPGDLDLSGAVFLATPQAQPDSSEELPDALADDPAAYTCTTDMAGRCTFHGPNEETFPFPFPFPSIPRLLTADRVDVDVPAGTYALTQVSSSPGLAPAAGSKTFTVCDGECQYPLGITGPVGNDSLFRTSLVTTVTDADTGAPLACAGYQLTGPDYPHNGTQPAAAPVTGTIPADCAAPTTVPTTSAPPSSTTPATTTATTTAPATSDPDQGTTSPAATTTTTSTTTSTTSPASPSSIVLDLAADEQPLVTYGTQTSDATGTMTFHGWFIPGDGYLLTPTTTPAGYAPDVTDGFAITTTAEQAVAEQPAAVARTLVTGLAAGAPAPAATTGAAAAATSTAAAATTTATTAAGSAGALAVTGTPVGTIALLGTGLVVLGGGALAAGTISRRRARSDA